jgi:hypothetical protein
MIPIGNDALLLLVFNPVDVFTHFAKRLNGLPKGQVIGRGTFLDLVGSRSTLAGEIQVSVLNVEGFGLILFIYLETTLTHSIVVADADIDAYVWGEDGDSQIVRPLLPRFSVSPFLIILSPSGRVVNSNNRRSSHPNSPSTLSSLATAALHHRRERRSLLRDSLDHLCHLRIHRFRPTTRQARESLCREVRELC